MLTREMSRWFGLVPREVLVMCRHTSGWRLLYEWFGFGSSGDVDTLFGSDFYRCLLGRCQDGLVLVPREMSSWFGFCSSGDAWLCVDTLLGSAFYRCLLGRCQDGLVSVTREM